MIKVQAGMAAGLMAIGSLAHAGSVNPNCELVPTGKGYGVCSTPSGKAKPVRGNGIYYHGGPLMLGTPNIYFIWYGNWSGNSATTLLPKLISDLSGSGYENIN